GRNAMRCPLPAPRWLVVVALLGGLARPAAAQEPLAPSPGAVPPRQALRASAPPVREWTNTLGMKLVLLPPGRFPMGTPVTQEGRGPDEKEHDVEISRPFYMGAHEVTIGQFRKFVDATGYQTDSEKGIGCFGFDPTTRGLDLNKRFSWKNPGWEVT